MTWSGRVAKLVNRVLPSGWTLVHPGMQPWFFHGGFSRRHNSRAKSAEGAPSRLYAYLDTQTALTQLHDGQLIYVDPQDQQLTPSLIAQGAWEVWIEDIIRCIVRPGDKVIEVGANVGYYTLIIGSLIGPTGHLHTFEANPRVAKLLRRTIGSSGASDWITLHENIVADRAGTMTFSSSTQAGGAGGIFENGREFGEDTLLNEVKAVRLDDLFPDQTFDLMRIDAEGSELLILNGALALLDRSKSIKLCVEWSVYMMTRRGDVAALIDRLGSMGFKFWRIDNPHGLEPSPVPTEEVINLPNCDVVIARTLN